MTDPQPPEDANKSLRSQTARGVVWMMSLKLAVRSLSLVSTLILVRLLAPADFGLVAMAMVLIAIMDMFSWFSFDVVLIQKQNADRSHYDTAWTFNVMFKTVSSLLLLILAYPAALYYSEPKVTVLVMVLAGAQFASGFENIGIVNFRKNMQFDREFRFMFYCKLSGFLITVPLAFILRNYWALVIGQVFSKVFAVGASFAMESYRPRFSLAARGELFNFSKWLALNNVFYALRLRVAEFVVGRISGARDLGYFNISQEISNTPTTELVQPINRAVYPAYAKISGKLESLRSGYVSVIAVISLIAVPAGFGIGATAELLVPIALGDQWLATIPLFSILAINGVLNALQTNIGSVFFSLAKPHLLTYLNMFHLCVLIGVAIPATMYYGIIGTAYAYVGSTLFMMPINYAVTFRTISLPARRFLSNVWRPVVAAILMYLATGALVSRLMEMAGGVATGLNLLLAIGFGALVYAVLVMAFWQLCGRPEGAESYVLQVLRDRLRSLRARRRSA